MSPANDASEVPLPENVLPAILLPDSWKNVGPGPFGNSKPSTPSLALFVMALCSMRSAYAGMSSTPTPHGAGAVVWLPGVARLLVSVKRLLRKIVQRAIFVESHVGVSPVFSPESH